jgi:Flp pilus assembly protein TadB
MKVREIYSSYLLVSGVICLILGIGNWMVGVIETSKYQALLYKTARTGLEENYRNFQQLDHQKNEEVLRRINEDREKYNGARVKLNFFYIVLMGGRVLLLIGAVLTLAMLVRLIRRDTQIKIRRLLRLAEAEKH